MTSAYAGMPAGLTGTRRAIPDDQAGAAVCLLTMMAPSALHTGMCVGGDEVGIRAAKALDIWCVGPPSAATHLMTALTVDEMRPAAGYLVRDRQLVNEVRPVIALPGSWAYYPRSGTWYTVRYAAGTGHPLIVVWPNGDIREYPPGDTRWMAYTAPGRPRGGLAVVH